MADRVKRQNKYKGWQIFRDKKPPFEWRAYHRKSRERIDCAKFEPYTLAFDLEVHRINELHKVKEAKPGTLGMLIKKYRASPKFQKRAARTKSDYQKVFDWLKPIEDTPLERFSRSFVAKIRDKAELQRGFRFANYVRSVLSIIFNWGLEYDYVKENPVEAVSLAERPKSLRDANRPWTDAERETVLGALPVQMVLPIGLMMFYGLDPQDALALPKVAVASAGIDTRRQKTGQPVYLPIFEPVAVALAKAPKHDATTLCANSRGQPWTYNGFSTNWDKLKKKLEKAGLVQPGLTLKGLRHTVGTILAEMGKDNGTIALVLGHATEAMAKHYSRRADRTRQTTAAVADFEAELNKRKTKVVKSTT
ncbi:MULTISPECIES: tyrosine-type recombinase/integrase [unclassified Ensifer]|uniref:tyrosine-type recombinase/integrase n=1 Tax=unclassified Ensifer TaxID=2633371 RepID=UPI000713B168|nr:MULTISPECIES: tyrosine-type recombinase/integrase [unclassified Ensifer]KQX40897.1 site-specific recombinase [Ensifer sp. Root1298]KQX70218.1 site-specific recombinase [Ensifer sp. Root1312]KRC14458.1 site-specific recombinase [Ensifer sp. Root74]